MPLVQDAEHAVLLSGTPMISRPKEMLTQLTALVPKARLKMKDFGERYCLSVNQRFGKYDGELLRPLILVDAIGCMTDSLHVSTSSSAAEAPPWCRLHQPRGAQQAADQHGDGAPPEEGRPGPAAAQTQAAGQQHSSKLARTRSPSFLYWGAWPEGLRGLPLAS